MDPDGTGTALSPPAVPGLAVLRGAATTTAAAVTTAAAKRALGRATGALDVDMESAGAVRAALAAGVAVSVWRVVLDPVDQAVPAAAAAALTPDGAIDPLTLLSGLCGRPADLPALVRLARDARRARHALGQAARMVLADAYSAATPPPGVPARP